MSSSSGLEREIDEYQDDTSDSGESRESSTSYDSSDEHYSSGVPGIPLGEFQELQRRMASGSGANSSRQDRKSTRLNSSHERTSRMPSSA